MSATDGLWRSAVVGDLAIGGSTRRALAASVFIVLGLGAFLVARRISGAATVPLPPLQLAFAALLLTAWTLAVGATLRERFAKWFAAGAVFLFAVACSFPGGRAIDWIIWLVGFGILIASQTIANRAKQTDETNVSCPPVPHRETVLQTLTRSRTGDGHDVLHGTLVAEFAPGQRIATIFVGFCPPFEQLPRVDLESAADAKVVQALHNGAQIEARLSTTAKTTTSVVVELYATDADA